MKYDKLDRRQVLKFLGIATGSALMHPMLTSFSGTEKMITRTVAASGESLPVVGLGTWQTFDVGASSKMRAILKQVLVEMNTYGGKVIDSSPMYGSSETVVGDLTSKLGFGDEFFYATKVWTRGKDAGIRQMENSFQRMRRDKMDLIQIHNLIDWKTHVKTLKHWKATGKVRYWGITHYVNSSHDELARIIKNERPDFVQFNYSIRSRHAEKALFKTIQDYGTAVLINQPFESGSLFRAVKGKDLPGWCKEYNINSWGQYFLKFILSNELVTCVIPGTSKPNHMIDNMKAGFGVLPDSRARERMATHLRSI